MIYIFPARALGKTTEEVAGDIKTLQQSTKICAANNTISKILDEGSGQCQTHQADQDDTRERDRSGTINI
jgi:hypothetical protein